MYGSNRTAGSNPAFSATNLVFMRVSRILSRIYHQTYHQLASNKKPVSPYRLLFPKAPIRVTDITLVAHLSLAGRVAVYICGALPVLTGKSQQVDLMQYVPGHYSAVRIILYTPLPLAIFTPITFIWRQPFMRRLV